MPAAQSAQEVDLETSVALPGSQSAQSSWPVPPARIRENMLLGLSINSIMGLKIKQIKLGQHIPEAV